ncbi:MAG: tRNA pseudouridine(38-40) synthase TruA [Pseudohongiellaceae bacterium]
MSETGARQRIALCLEYDGSSFCGWQAQKSPRVATVQEALEAALTSVADQPVKVICAGRTDTGVHASAQIVHFDSPGNRNIDAWIRGGNALLPATVSVLWGCPVTGSFHARFSALSRRYRYIIHNNRIRPAILRNLVTCHYPPLDTARMAAAGKYLLGELDFTSYRGAACQSPTPMRNVSRLEVRRQGDFVIVDIEANAFLLHMVRNIVGVLLEIGEGRREPEWARQVLDSRDRCCAGVTARPAGLYLVKVSYPEHFALPPVHAGPAFLMP